MANCNTQQLNITCGTDVVLHDRLIFNGETFDPNLSVGIAANLVSSLGKRTALEVEVVDEYLIINVPWIDGTLPGCYGLEVTGSCNSKKWSTYADSLIRYTKATRIGASDVTVESDTYDITQEVGYMYSNSPVTFAEVTVDDGYGTPSVDVEYEQRELRMDFHNLKGNGITSIEKTASSSEDEGINEWTITETDENQTIISVRNGSKGSKGDKGDQGDSIIVGEGDLPLAHVLGRDNTKAISQQGVTDELLVAESTISNPSAVSDVSGRITDLNPNTWKSNDSAHGSGRTLNVANYVGKYMKINPQEGKKVLYAFVKKGYKYDDVVDYATGSSKTTITSSVTVIVPQDATLLWYASRMADDADILPPDSLEVSETLKNKVGVMAPALQIATSSLNDLMEDVAVSEFTLVGENSPTNTGDRVLQSVRTTPGEVYQITLSSKEWATTYVKSTAAVFFAQHCTKNAVATAQGYVYDRNTGVRLRFDRPSDIPSLTFVFEAKQPWVIFSFRGDVGESVDVTITKLSELTALGATIEGLDLQLEELRNGIGLNQDIVTVNGGFTELDAKFQALVRRKNQNASSQGNKPCVLLHFSDLHGYTGALNRILEFDETFSQYIDDMIHTGDTANNNFGDPNRFQDLDDAYVLNVIGNHDYWVSGAWSSRVIAEQTQVYEKYIKPFADYHDSELNGSGITQPEDAESIGLCYYYKDYTESKLRLIVLDCMYWDEDENTWFASVLEGARTLGYSVLCADHYCPHSSWTPMRECTFQSVVAGINTSDTDSILAPAAAATLQAAIDNGLQFVCWIFGHHHRDQFGYLADYPIQFAMAVDKAANNESHERDSKRMTTGRTVDCFNIITIDTTCKIMSVMRIGNNRDKFMRQKNYLVFDYANCKILHNS